MKLLSAVSLLLPCALALSATDDKPLQARLKTIFGDMKAAESDLATLGSSKADAHTKQLMKRLEGEVDEALPDELRKLSEVFHDEERKTGVVKAHRRSVSTFERAPHVERIVDKLAKRRFKRHEDRSGCSEKFSMSEVGYAPEAAKFLTKSFLQEPEEEEEGSFTSKPGSGSDQKFADNGRSNMGKVAGEEVLVTVYKDGFWPVGCIADSMIKSGDKFGPGKHSYKEEYTNVSVALYSELVLKDAQKPMTPHTCFEFCRSMDGMSFFGIKDGRTCYCMPYYKPSASGSGMCDLPCPGDEMQICGGKAKSSVFEMHTCGDRGAALTTVAATAGEALSAFYAAALFSGKYSDNLQSTGAKLQTLGGLSGSPTTGDYGQTAKEYAGEAGHVLMDGECMEAYDELLVVYEESEGTSLLDMKKAANLAALEESASKMEKLTPKVAECAKKAGKATEAGYPAYGAAIESTSADDFDAYEESFGTTLAQYYPLMYALDNKKTPMQSVCESKPVGAPAVGTLAECAEACDAQWDPKEKCTGFQFYDVGDAMPVCFLFTEITKAYLFECDFIEAGNEALKEEKKLFLQKDSEEETRVANNIIKMAEEGKEPEEEEEKELPKMNEGHCSSVKANVMYTGSTCADLYGSGHAVKDACPDVCKKTDGAKVLASCFLKLSEISASMKMFKIMEEKRCFGGKDNSEVSESGVDAKLVPFDDQGAVLAGDATIGGKTVSEPVIWAAPEEA